MKLRSESFENKVAIICLSASIIFIALIDGLNKENKNNSNIGKVVNNNEEDKKVTENKSEDKNKEKEEVSSKPSRINLRLIIFIFVIIIIAVIIFFTIIKLIIKNKKKFKFNEESRKDFAKENFCPTFFLIGLPQCQDLKNLKNVEINDVKEDAECFFEILAKLIFFDKDDLEPYNNIKEVNIILGASERGTHLKKNNDNTYTYALLFESILIKISDFASLLESVTRQRDNVNNIDIKTDNLMKDFIGLIKKDRIATIKESKEKAKVIKARYDGEEFDSYLCAYLLYYLSETIIQNSQEIKEVNFFNKKEIKTDTIYTTFFHENEFICNNCIRNYICNIYNINYDIISKILKKLLNDKPIENVKF